MNQKNRIASLRLWPKLLALFLTLATVLATVSPAVALSRSVAAWLPYWDHSNAMTIINNNPNVFDEISLFWYDLGVSGNLIPQVNSENQSMLASLRAKGIKLYPTISNEFNGPLVSTMVNNPLAREIHINNIVNKVITMGYDGIDIDYENMAATDKTGFSTFITELSTALHAKGKKLIVTVHPKTEAVGDYGGPMSQDYSVLGQKADRVRIMAYDYTWAGGTPGSIAPVAWVEKVVKYAASTIPLDKIVLGIPNYGYDWPATGKGKGITYDQAMSLAATYKAVITEDLQNGAHFTYTINGNQHTVWFENAKTLAAKLDLVNKYNIRGIAIWRLGGEDTKTYATIAGKYAGANPFPSPVPVPTPVPVPAPKPTPVQVPVPAPKPTPVPDTKPVPVTDPKPVPAPDTNTVPDTNPTPAPAPAPDTTPVLDTNPTPAPGTTIPVSDAKPVPAPGTTIPIPDAKPVPVTVPKPEVKPVPVTTKPVPVPKPTPAPVTKPAPTPSRQTKPLPSRGTIPADRIKPSLKVTNWFSKGKLNISAAAWDKSGITKVVFTVDGKTKLVDTKHAYFYAGWFSKTKRSHLITVTAYDKAGNKTVVQKKFYW